mgnify:CR=1 FL=1
MKALWRPRYDYGNQDRAVILTDNGLKNYVKEKNFWASRDGDDIGAFKSWHDNGFATLYINKTANKTFEELIKYELEGMTVENTGLKTGVVQVKIGPGEEQLIKLIDIKGAKEKKLSTTISRRKIT